jgi:DNA-binding GntR family transcriptional regulator
MLADRYGDFVHFGGKWHARMLETRSIVDALRLEIQSRILTGSIPPGTALPEISVAQMFDVARPTAKAAIDQLVLFGLLRRSRNKTASVPLLGAADVTDLYLSRAVVENAVVKLLAERGDVPAAAVEALDRFRTLVGNSAQLAELVASDVAFHRALVAATGRRRLRLLHELMIGEAHLCMAQVQVNHLLRPQMIADEHARILELIAARDVSQATSEMDAHISRARNMLVAHLERQPADIANKQPA